MLMHATLLMLVLMLILILRLMLVLLVLLLVIMLILIIVTVLMLPYFAFHINGRISFRLAGATIPGTSTSHSMLAPS